MHDALIILRRARGAPFHACAGRFLVRKTGAKQQEDGKMFILSVCYKGKPTHHMITKDDQTGGLKINNKAYGTTKTIKAVGLTFLTLHPGCPPLQLHACSVTVSQGTPTADLCMTQQRCDALWGRRW